MSRKLMLLINNKHVVTIMKSKTRWSPGAFLILGVLVTQVMPAAYAEDVTVNRLLASQCAQCHGTNGYAIGEFDAIAGEEAKDLFEDLADMKGEDAPENIMDHQALGYTNAQIHRIARFYATLPEESSEESEEED